MIAAVGARAPGFGARDQHGAEIRLAEIADSLPEVREVVATGHALLENEWWIQLFADVLGRPVTASAVPEGSARGAAVHALERLGVEADDIVFVGDTAHDRDCARQVSATFLLAGWNPRARQSAQPDDIVLDEPADVLRHR